MWNVFCGKTGVYCIRSNPLFFSSKDCTGGFLSEDCDLPVLTQKAERWQLLHPCLEEANSGELENTDGMDSYSLAVYYLRD